MWTDGSRPCYDNKFRSSVLDRQCRHLVFNESPLQVICIFFLPRWVTRYWACCGFVLGVLLRSLAGEPLLGLPDVLRLPWENIQEDGHRYHLFSFRTATNAGTILLISQLTECLSEKSFLKTNPHTDYNIHYTAPVQTDMEDSVSLILLKALKKGKIVVMQFSWQEICTSGKQAPEINHLET